MAAIAGGGRTHPTFVEIGTNEALYVHRTGSNVVNGRYYVDKDPRKTIGHYSAFRRVDTAALRAQYEAAVKMPLDEATKGSPLDRRRRHAVAEVHDGQRRGRRPWSRHAR